MDCRCHFRPVQRRVHVFLQTNAHLGCSHNLCRLFANWDATCTQNPVKCGSFPKYLSDGKIISAFIIVSYSSARSHSSRMTRWIRQSLAFHHAGTQENRTGRRCFLGTRIYFYIGTTASIVGPN